ncbi:ABC transporter substrate-binding protein [Flavobacterium sp.]|uniref:ABC transporter substrate-binding protein n=1 Tax=Flavobacterium sp. TaxID=239 RepID=UPI00286C2271|nr:ABC transporter substrate-binding protein [Flavobacterium sp.]
MKSVLIKIPLLFLLIFAVGCQQKTTTSTGDIPNGSNQIEYAKGFSIVKHNGFSIVKITNPWPNATKAYTYILQEKNSIIPDSLKQNPIIPIPIKKIVVTSTTHIPSLEMLGVENSLIGFPNLDYISSEKVRHRIEAGKIKELGSNQNLNTEVLIDSAPDVIIGFGIDNNNPTLDNLQKSGLKVLLNGDWNEQTPLGKAEWIKLFGALYGLDSKANALFNSIVADYKNTLKLAAKTTTKPTVMAGAIYENQWYLPQGNSWGCYFLKEANAQYLWADSKGTGSLSLSFETVFEKAQNADIWIGPGEFVTLKEMLEANPHYDQFKAFKNKKVYSYSTRKGKKGGLIFYELAPNRPDLVLKDILKITHPELLPDYQLYFYEQLQ